MHIVCPDISQQREQVPSSEATPIAQCFPSTAFQRRSSRPTMSRGPILLPTLKGGRRSHLRTRSRTSSVWTVPCRRTSRRRDWTRRGTRRTWRRRFIREGPGTNKGIWNEQWPADCPSGFQSIWRQIDNRMEYSMKRSCCFDQRNTVR